jgi:hypothetical protein
MPKAGSIQRITFERKDADGDDVPGKVLADFAFPAWQNGAAVVLTVGNLVALGGPKYSIDLTVPATLGRLRVDCTCLNPTTDTLDPDVLEGEVTANDIDSVAVLAARPPSVTLAANISPRSEFTIEVFKGDGRTIEVPIYDDNGDLVDLSLWENFRFSIKASNQVAVAPHLPYNLDAGITGIAAGILRIPLPEDCSAYGAHPVGRAKTTLYWSGDANKISEGATKTRTLRAGPFVIRSKETP